MFEIGFKNGTKITVQAYIANYLKKKIEQKLEHLIVVNNDGDEPQLTLFISVSQISYIQLIDNETEPNDNVVCPKCNFEISEKSPLVYDENDMLVPEIECIKCGCKYRITVGTKFVYMTKPL